MIRISARIRGDEYLLDMEGHARYHPGNDVVCAGASALVYALVGYLHNCGPHLYEQMDEQVDSGAVRLHFRGDAQAGAAFSMALIGLVQIARQYPGHVSVQAGEDGI